MVTNPEPPVEPQSEPEREPPAKETPFNAQETRPLTPHEESAGSQAPVGPDATDAFDALLSESMNEGQPGAKEASQPEWLSQYTHLSVPVQPESEPSEELIPDWLAAYLSAEDFVASGPQSVAGQPDQAAEIAQPSQAAPSGPPPSEIVSPEVVPFDFDALEFDTPPAAAASTETAPVEPVLAGPPESSLPVVAPFLIEAEPEPVAGETEKPPEAEPASPESPPAFDDNLSDVRRALQEEELQAQSLKKPPLIHRMTSRLRGTARLDASAPVKPPEPEKPAVPATGQFILPAASSPPAAPGEAEIGIDESQLLRLGAGAAVAGAVVQSDAAETEPGQPDEPYALPPGALPEDLSAPPGESPPETALTVVPSAPPEELPQPARPAASKLTWRQKVSQILTGTPAGQDAGLTDEDLERRLGTGTLIAAASDQAVTQAEAAPPEEAEPAAAGYGLFLAEEEQPVLAAPPAMAEAGPDAPSSAQTGIAPPFPGLFEEQAVAEPVPEISEPEISEAQEWVEDEPTRLNDEQMAALFLTGSETGQRTPPGEQPAGPLAGELAAPVENYTDLRSIALTGYTAEETRAPDPFVIRQLKRLSPLQIVFLLAFVLVDIALVCAFGFVLLYGLLPVRSIASVPPAPAATVSNFGGPFPVSLALPGGWSFKLESGEIRDGKWEPTGPEWLQGTNIRRVVALPWNKQLEAVVRASAPGDQIDLAMSNGQTLPYKVMMVMEVPAGQASSLQVDFPALYVVLAHKDMPTRWVILAVPAAEAKTFGGTPTP